MRGGGFMSHIQSSLKNNRRKKKRLFDTLERYVKTSKDFVIIDKKITPIKLKNIREQIHKESFIKAIFYTIVVAIILFFLIKFAPV